MPIRWPAVSDVRRLLGFLLFLCALMIVLLYVSHPFQPTWNWLIVGGYLSEGVGLIVAGWGIGKTWKQYAAEGFFDPTRRRFGPWYRGIRRFIFRRDVTLKDTSGPMAAEVGMANERAVVGKANVKPDSRDMETAITELHRQVSEVRKDFDKFVLEQTQVNADTVAMIAEVSRQVAVAESKVQEAERRISIDGLRIEAVGLGLVGLGLIAQAVGSALG